MAELEMTFKYSYNELLMLRFALLGIVNIILNILFSLILHSRIEDISSMGLFFYWCTPFLFISSISLLISMYIRGRYVSLIILGVWSSASIYLTSKLKFIENLLDLSTIQFLFVSCIAIFIYYFSFSRLLKNIIFRGDYIVADS